MNDLSISSAATTRSQTCFYVLMHPGLPSRHRESRRVHGAGYHHKPRHSRVPNSHPRVSNSHPREGGDPETYQDIAGFCKSATLNDIKANDYVLTPGRYVGAADIADDGIAFETKMAELSQTLYRQMAEVEALDKAIRQNLRELGFGN